MGDIPENAGKVCKDVNNSDDVCISLIQSPSQIPRTICRSTVAPTVSPTCSLKGRKKKRSASSPALFSPLGSSQKRPAPPTPDVNLYCLQVPPSHSPSQRKRPKTSQQLSKQIDTFISEEVVSYSTKSFRVDLQESAKKLLREETSPLKTLEMCELGDGESAKNFSAESSLTKNHHHKDKRSEELSHPKCDSMSCISPLKECDAEDLAIAYSTSRQPLDCLTDVTCANNIVKDESVEDSLLQLNTQQHGVVLDVIEEKQVASAAILAPESVSSELNKENATNEQTLVPSPSFCCNDKSSSAMSSNFVEASKIQYKILTPVRDDGTLGVGTKYMESPSSILKKSINKLTEENIDEEIIGSTKRKVTFNLESNTNHRFEKDPEETNPNFSCKRAALAWRPVKRKKRKYMKVIQKRSPYNGVCAQLPQFHSTHNSLGKENVTGLSSNSATAGVPKVKPGSIFDKTGPIYPDFVDCKDPVSCLKFFSKGTRLVLQSRGFSTVGDLCKMDGKTAQTLNIAENILYSAITSFVKSSNGYQHNRVLTVSPST